MYVSEFKHVFVFEENYEVIICVSYDQQSAYCCCSLGVNFHSKISLNHSKLYVVNNTEVIKIYLLKSFLFEVSMNALDEICIDLTPDITEHERNTHDASGDNIKT